MLLQLVLQTHWHTRDGIDYYDTTTTECRYYYTKRIVRSLIVEV